MVNLETYFDRVFLVNLARRPDRLEECTRRFLPPDWPFQTPERFDAIDGQRVPSPLWWTQGGGAWGVYRSHMAIIERCLNENVGRILVLEDDAIPVSDFGSRVREFLSNLPDDWQLAYLGGQTNHFNQREHPPRVVNDHVIIPWSCNRLHAFALTSAGMKIVYKHLTARDWNPRHHVDHRIEVLSQTGRIKTYAPRDWLIGQSDGKSDICDRELPVRFFNRPPKPRQGPPTVLAVVGPYRGGTSAVAGAIHHLGIIMGHHFFTGGQAASPKGCFEAKRLFDICFACYPEPQFVEAKPYNKRVALLKGWLTGRRNEGPVIGAKHPKLCLMIPEMLEAWPGCKFVVVHRPTQESVKSLAKLGWWKQAQPPEDLIRRFVETRDRDIATVPQDRVMHIDYAKFLKNPQTELEAVAKFTGVEPLPEQYRRACGQVDPALKHYTVEAA